MRLGIPLLTFLLWCRVAAWAAEPEAAADAVPPWDPTSTYVTQSLEGWQVRVSKRLLAEPELARRTLRQLEFQLYQITRVVPARALEQLRQIPIWVERAYPRHPCMCYHESAEWLRAHAMNPEKAGAVEIANAENFLRWTLDQPWMVLHELAHGYHHRFLGENHPDLLRCFEQAAASGRYASVLRGDGTRGRAYALTNVKEYFAELSEAFFGVNDFHPFVRAELLHHDPAMYAVLRQVWGVDPE